MVDLNRVSLHVRNHKCFRGDAQGFDQILPVNLLIGRNNAGKSALLDVVEIAVQGATKEANGIQRDPLPDVRSIEITAPITEDVIISNPDIPANMHRAMLDGCLGSLLRWREFRNGHRAYVSGEAQLVPFDQPTRDSLVVRSPSPFFGLEFFRLQPDRDIRPEAATAESEYELRSDGSGATNILQGYINRAHLPGDLVQQRLLDALNRIMRPDAVFSKLETQLRPDEKWEVFLTEEKKGRVALSDSGSGLKTVIMVLVSLYLLPKIRKKTLSDFVFGYEELENNLHPALQRRLLRYLREVAENKRATFILTTHSPVAIDLFGRDDKAQILHVTHDGESAAVERVDGYYQQCAVLEDLDVRASDLLQANGVIWVEGPSDRIYVNRWLRLLGDGEFREGIHYHCAFYGGALLSHLTASEEESVGQFVNLLRINRNAVLVMDSDRESTSCPLSQAKNRLIAELESAGGIAWVTEG